MSRQSKAVFVLLSWFLLSVSSGHGAEPQPASEAPVVLPGCFQFDLKSKAGLEYRIFVHASQGRVSEAGSPVVYLTDANSNFPLMMVALQRQHALKDAVIVGIGYPEEDVREHSRRRTRDLLFPVDPAWIKSQPPQHTIYMAQATGGADQFLDFIEQELKPHVEQRFQIDRQRQLLFGQSFGGLFVLHALFHRPESFQMYCAASPSIWVDDRSILKEVPAFLSRLNSVQHPVQLLVTVGEEENPGFGGPPDREAMLKSRRQVDNARELTDALAGAAPLLGVRFEMFVREDHGTAMLPAANRALQMLAKGGKNVTSPRTPR